MIQTTICAPIDLKGVGIHSGELVAIRLLPASENTGFIFVRTDYDQHQIPVLPSSLHSTNRATILRYNNVQIATPEHLLAACYGLGLDNLIIEIDNEEVPIMDGSSEIFVAAIRKVGIKSQSIPTTIRNITEPIKLTDGDKAIIALPDKQFKLTYFMEYPDHFIGSQSFTLEWSPDNFSLEISPARTFGFHKEIEALLAKGLAKGGSLNNAVVIGENEYLNPLRFPDELVRHKILDMIGDLATTGTKLTGHFIGMKSGHALNMALVKALERLDS